MAFFTCNVTSNIVHGVGVSSPGGTLYLGCDRGNTFWDINPRGPPFTCSGKNRDASPRCNHTTEYRFCPKRQVCKECPPSRPIITYAYNCIYPRCVFLSLCKAVRYVMHVFLERVENDAYGAP
ncbi:unnamed protein product [Ectocarpus sp. 12 AP-2014]